MKKTLCLIMALAMILSLALTVASADWDGTITVVQNSDVFVFDPTASADVNNKNCLKNCLSRLYETDDWFNPIPTLATSYEQSEDGLTWTFTIADGVKFFDGTPLTIDDIIYCYTRVKNTKCSGQTLLEPVIDMYEQDGKLVMVTDHVYGSLLTALSNSATAILSAEWVKKADAGECTWEEAVMNGACGRYKIESRNTGVDCVLVKNEDYFDPACAGKSDKIIFRIIPEATTRAIMVSTGEADLDVNFDTAQMDTYKADPNVQILEHESSKVYEMWLRVDSPALSNKLVRQAIGYAINREDCLQIGCNGYGQVWTNCWAPYVKGAAAENSDYTYDPAKAADLLAQAGVTSLEITACVTTDEEQRVADIVQMYLQMVGINMSVTRIDKAVLASEMGAGTYDIAFASSTFYDDPELFFQRQYGEAGIGVGNYSHFTSEECMALLAEANATLDPEFRLAKYNEINKIVMDEACVLGLYNSVLFDLARTGLQGVNMNVETTYWFDTIHY